MGKRIEQAGAGAGGEFASFSPLAKLPGSRLERTWMYNRQRNEGGEMRTIALATLLAGGLLTTPALADQKFCGPEGTLEVHATSFTYKPHDSGDKTKVALATRHTKFGFDLVVAARAGLAVGFIPDAQAHYTVYYNFPQPKWPGWAECR